MEVIITAIAALAGYGGYRVGLGGEDRDSGLAWSIMGGLLFAVPMGLWAAFNVLIYAANGGRAGFRAEDVRVIVTLALVAAGVWLGAAAVGLAVRQIRNRKPR